MNLTITPEPPPLVVNPDHVILVRGTRVPLDTIVFEFKPGATVEGLVEQYSSLDLADVYAVISYYLRHQSDVGAYLQQRQQTAEKVRTENEHRFPSKELHDLLLAQRQLRT
ncbi:MAG: DUF433 domain-containing protein [Verrucomicrobia bacterium]|nr:DUF433 domain-containing protein [Leptolyngbya sp. ES-bin-22]